MKPLSLISLLACVTSQPLLAADMCSKTSPSHTVALLELYTSHLLYMYSMKRVIKMRFYQY